MEISELKQGLEIFFVSGIKGYEDYPLERLLELAQQEDDKAKLQILANFKGLIYNTLVHNGYYMQLSVGDALQTLNEVLLNEIAAWESAEAEAFGNHIKYCLRTAVWSEIRRVKKHDFKEMSYDDGDTDCPSAAEKQLEAVEYKYFDQRDKRATQQFSVRELLGGLTEKQRYVLTAEIFEDRNDVEIACMMNVKKAAVCRIKRRAVNKLRRILKVRKKEGLTLC